MSQNKSYLFYFTFSHNGALDCKTSTKTLQNNTPLLENVREDDRQHEERLRAKCLDFVFGEKRPTIKEPIQTQILSTETLDNETPMYDPATNQTYIISTSITSYGFTIYCRRPTDIPPSLRAIGGFPASLRMEMASMVAFGSRSRAGLYVFSSPPGANATLTAETAFQTILQAHQGIAVVIGSTEAYIPSGPTDKGHRITLHFNTPQNDEQLDRLISTIATISPTAILINKIVTSFSAKILMKLTNAGYPVFTSITASSVIDTLHNISALYAEHTASKKDALQILSSQIRCVLSQTLSTEKNENTEFKYTIIPEILLADTNSNKRAYAAPSEFIADNEISKLVTQIQTHTMRLISGQSIEDPNQ